MAHIIMMHSIMVHSIVHTIHCGAHHHGAHRSVLTLPSPPHALQAVRPEQAPPAPPPLQRWLRLVPGGGGWPVSQVVQDAAEEDGL